MYEAAGATIVVARGEIKVIKETRLIRTHFRAFGKFIGIAGSD